MSAEQAVIELRHDIQRLRSVARVTRHAKQEARGYAIVEGALKTALEYIQNEISLKVSALAMVRRHLASLNKLGANQGDPQ